MKSLTARINESFITEAISVTKGHFDKYFKLIAKDIGARSYDVNIKDGLTEVKFDNSLSLYVAIDNDQTGRLVAYSVEGV